MHLIVRRYNRSGTAALSFYAALCVGFGAMAIWALVQGDWLVAVIAMIMTPTTIAGSRLTRRLQGTEAESQAQSESGKGELR